MQINELLKRLKKQYPDTETELYYKNEFELLISVVLSAQATDKQINKLTPGLFKAFPSAELLSKAEPEKVENLIRSSGYYKQKTKSIINFLETLEDNDDVQHVYANLEIDSQLSEKNNT